jgi:hypothetical protein
MNTLAGRRIRRRCWIRADRAPHVLNGTAATGRHERDPEDCGDLARRTSSVPAGLRALARVRAVCRGPIDPIESRPGVTPRSAIATVGA